MLKAIHDTVPRDGVDLEAARTDIGSMSWPAPFPSVLEYNSPAHGNWNIVHIGMNVPEAHQIYVCADNCLRGVILTAAEMEAQERFSSITIREDDLYNGRMEDNIIEGVGEILDGLDKKPRIVFLFTVCLHHFLGTDLAYIYSELRRRHPDVIFVDSYMDCIMQKDGLSPDEKLRIGMYRPLQKRPLRKDQISIIGNDLLLYESCEIYEIARRAGMRVMDISACTTFDEYMQMSESFLDIATFPNAKPGCEQLARRLGQECLYLPQCFGYDEIEGYLRKLASAAGLDKTKLPDFSKLRAETDAALEHAREVIQDTPVAIDAMAFPRVLGCARLLLEHGINVVRVYADGFSAEEEQDYGWLLEHRPQLEVYSTIHPEMRLMPREYPGKILGIGPKCAYFTQSHFYVNIVEGGGLYGFDGIKRLCGMMEEAFAQPKEIENIIVRKGIGCPSCIDI